MVKKCNDFCDYANVNTSHLANFGGNWNNTSNAGVFQLNVNHSASNSNTNYSAHLMFLINKIFFYCTSNLTSW